MNNRIILSAIFLLLMVTGLTAESHDAHEHGAVVAQIELGATEGHIQFKLTGMDFIGFAYIAKSDEEIEMVHEKVDAVLESDLIEIKSRLFSSAKIHHIYVDEPGHGDHDADHDDHDVDHDDHDVDHDDHDVDHDDHDVDHDEHTDYLITVEVEYSSSNKLKVFDLSEFFKLFPSVEEVEWVIISDNGQKAGEATIKNPVIKID